MKIRTGFVSNSSSSSFIIGLPREPQSAKELLELWVPGWEIVDPKVVGACPRCLAKAIWELMGGWTDPDDSDDTKAAAGELSAEDKAQRLDATGGGYDDSKVAGIVKRHPYLLHVKVPLSHYLRAELKALTVLENTGFLWGED